jgi:hypothetical protein
MSRIVGETIPQDLYHRLSGDEIAKQVGKVVVLLTTDEHGWAHPAMMSHFEVMARSPSLLYLAIGNKSRTYANLNRTGKATLIFTDSGGNYYVKTRVQMRREALEKCPSEALFALQVEQVLEDVEAAAPFVSGPTVSMPEGGEALAFTRTIFDELQRAH